MDNISKHKQQRGNQKKAIVDFLFHKSNSFSYRDYVLPIKKVIEDYKKKIIKYGKCIYQKKVLEITQLAMQCQSICILKHTVFKCQEWQKKREGLEKG